MASPPISKGEGVSYGFFVDFAHALEGGGIDVERW
jgi:hypothetical protein